MGPIPHLTDQRAVGLGLGCRLFLGAHDVGLDGVAAVAGICPCRPEDGGKSRAAAPSQRLWPGRMDSCARAPPWRHAAAKGGARGGAGLRRWLIPVANRAGDSAAFSSVVDRRRPSQRTSWTSSYVTDSAMGGCRCSGTGGAGLATPLPAAAVVCPTPWHHIRTHPLLLNFSLFTL